MNIKKHYKFVLCLVAIAIFAYLLQDLIWTIINRPYSSISPEGVITYPPSWGYITNIITAILLLISLSFIVVINLINKNKIYNSIYIVIFFIIFFLKLMINAVYNITQYSDLIKQYTPSTINGIPDNVLDAILKSYHSLRSASITIVITTSLCIIALTIFAAYLKFKTKTPTQTQSDNA